MAKEMLLGVADALIIDAKTGLQMYSATLSSHTIEQSVDSTDLRGGRTNKIIGRLKTNKGLTVTVEDLQQTKEMQAFLSGGSIDEDLMEAYSMPQEIKYTTGGIVGAKEPKDATTVICTNAINGTKYVVQYDGQALKVGENGGQNSPGTVVTELPEGTPIILGAYIYMTETQVEYFNIASNKFAGNVAVVLEEDVYDGETMEIIKVKQTIIPVASPDENFSLSGSSEISETTASYTFTALASGDCDNLGYVVYLEAPKTTC